MNLNTTLVDVAAKDLTGMALDLAVAAFDKRCEGLTWVWVPADKSGEGYFEGRGQIASNSPEVACAYIARRGVLDVVHHPHMVGVQRYAPSSNWADGGPLVDDYRFNIAASGTGPKDENGNEPIVALVGTWKEVKDRARAMDAPTHLVAVCRSIVATYAGDIVKVPAHLVLP